MNPEDCDLAQIENLQDTHGQIRKGIGDASLATGSKLHTTLDDLGYSKFIQMQPKLAIGHILKRITHLQLCKHMKLTFKLQKEKFRKEYPFFMRETTKEARELNRHDAASTFDDSHDSDSDLHISNPKSGDSKSSGGLRGSSDRKKGTAKQNKVAPGSQRENHAMYRPASKKW